MQDGTLWFSTWEVCVLIASLVYGYRILKIISKIGDDWRGEDNTKLKYLEVAGVKRKVRERN